METQTSYAVPQEDGGLQLYSATQGPDFVTRCVSYATGLPANKVRVELRRMGGAYGGKITRALQPAVAVSVASMITGCPVRTQVCLLLH
jgi:xanthine dehydrogenase large subunit